MPMSGSASHSTVIELGFWLAAKRKFCGTGSPLGEAGDAPPLAVKYLDPSPIPILIIFSLMCDYL